MEGAKSWEQEAEEVCSKERECVEQYFFEYNRSEVVKSDLQESLQLFGKVLHCHTVYVK